MMAQCDARGQMQLGRPVRAASQVPRALRRASITRPAQRFARASAAPEDGAAPAAAEAAPAPAAGLAPAPGKAAPSPADVDAALVTLRAAAKDASNAPAKKVLDAMRLVERAKPQGIDWPSVLAGKSPSSIRRWRLAYTADGKELARAMKGESTKGGMYWSVPPAAIGYRPDGTIENGVYLGAGLASLRFDGNYDVKANKVGFEFSRVTIKLGPLTLPITLKKEPTSSWDNPAKADGLFIMVYGDDDIVVARGKGGGIALWQNAPPTWLMENGVA